jgi:hypothetical protein
MQCFNHHDQPAIGMCKHCCKGLCPACATDLGHGLACRETHEEQVASVHSLVTKVARVQSVTRSNKYLSPALFAVLGSVFVGYGLFQGGGAATLTVAMGAVFLLYGFFLFSVVRKAYGQPKS